MSEETMQVVRFVCVTGVWGMLASLVFIRLFPQLTESSAKRRADLLRRTLEAERDFAEETVRLRDELSNKVGELAAMERQRDGYIEGNRQTLRALAEANEIAARYKRERDEARREICERENTIRCEHGYDQFDEQSIAAERGWDCFKEGVES